MQRTAAGTKRKYLHMHRRLNNKRATNTFETKALWSPSFLAATFICIAREKERGECRDSSNYGVASSTICCRYPAVPVHPYLKISIHIKSWAFKYLYIYTEMLTGVYMYTCEYWCQFIILLIVSAESGGRYCDKLGKRMYLSDIPLFDQSPNVASKKQKQNKALGVHLSLSLSLYVL